MGSIFSDYMDKRRARKQGRDAGAEYATMHGRHEPVGMTMADVSPASPAPGHEPVTGLRAPAQLESPYVAGRREWNERYGSYIERAHTWKLVALASMGLSAILVYNLVAMANSSKVVPYVVELDKLGNQVAVKPAERILNKDQRVVRAQLSAYVSNARSITPDRLVQKRWLDGVYAISTPSAANFLNDYYKKNDPFEKGKYSLVAVEINSCLPMAPSTTSWQVQWTETTRGLDGLVQGVAKYNAILNTTSYTPTTEEAINANPSGTAVDQISWNQIL